MSELGDRIQLIFDVARPYEEKIKKLEQQKAELIEFISDVDNYCKQVGYYPSWYYRIEKLQNGN